MSMSGEVASSTTIQSPSTAGEVLDLSLNASSANTATTMQNQNTAKEMICGQEGGSLARLPGGGTFPTGSTACPGLNRGFDYMDGSWLAFNPFLARSFAQNISTVQAQLPSGMLNMPFGWPLRLDHMTSTSEEDVIDLSLNNTETTVGKVTPSMNSSPAAGLANGNGVGFLPSSISGGGGGGGDSFNAGSALLGISSAPLQPPYPPLFDGLELAKRSAFDPTSIPPFIDLPTLQPHSLRFGVPTSVTEMPLLKPFSDGTLRLPNFSDGSLTLGSSAPMPSASKGLMAMSLPDFYAKNPWGHKDCNDILKKCQSYQECGNQSCRMAGNREHFHCLQCEKVIIRREEAIRHLKWHKKREESLQYGFMRYSPSDDCGNSDCSYNTKQTHYHCLQPNCSKTYISTSDVQMHANYHRKDAVILQEGFQRYRATEVCDVPDCPYVDERTTHFHCKRTGCNFTFKNKADIEKHKNHHQKNDEHAKNGFRKFTKYEVCRFPGCKYSSVMNHIHCIRPGCDYVVHSSSQILSHKRKHERRQMTSMMNLSSSESIYDNLLSAKSISDFRMGLTTVNTPVSGNDSPDLSQDNSSHPPPPPPPLLPLKDSEYTQIRSTTNDSPSREERLGGNETSPLACSNSPPSPVIASVLQAVSHAANACWSQWRYNRLPDLQTKLRIPGEPNGPSAAAVEEASELFIKTILAEVLPSMTPFAASQSCEKVECPFRYTGTAHFHCLRADCCENPSSSLRADLWEEHWLLHARQSALSRLGFMPCDAGPTCPGQQHSESAGQEGLGHVHCRLAGDCSFAISALAFSPALGLRHWASQHDKRFAVGLEMRPEGTSFEPCKRLAMSTPRKRGRPPKNARGIRVPRPELPEELCVDESPLISVTREMFFNPPDGAGVRGGMKIYPVGGPPCPDELCQFRSHEHYHCVQPRCHTATASLFVVNSHRVEFHAQTDIESGYEYFDRSVDCRRASCYNNRVNGHFHCVRPRCDYTFVRYSKMAQHSRKHHENDNAACGGGGGGGVGVGASSLQSSGPPKTVHFTGNMDMNPLGISKLTGAEFTDMPPLQLPTTMLPPLGAKYLPDLWTPASQSQMPSLFFLLTNFFNSQASTNTGAGVELLPQPSLPTPPEERGLPPTTTSENEVPSETSSPANVFPEGSVASEKMEWEEGEEEDQRTSSPTMGRQSEKLIAS